MSRLTERLVAGLLFLFLLLYAGYQALRYFHTPIKTETVYTYSVSHTLTSQGIVFRDEIVLDNTAAGYENYLYEDGQRVLIGQPVIEYYASATGNAGKQQLQEAEREIAMLTEAQNTAINHFSNADALGRDIKVQLASLVQMNSTGRYSELQATRAQLTDLLNRRQIATGKEQDYQARIDQLTAQVEALTASARHDTIATVGAPTSGYFAQSVDGYESLMTLDTAQSLTVEGFRELVEHSAQPRAGSTGSGRIMVEQNWMVAVSVEKLDVQWVQAGQSVDLQFEGMDQAIPGSVAKIVTDDSDMAVLLITCNYVNDQTLDLRNTQITVNFRQYAGLRINNSSLRFQDGVRGVYVLERGVIRFKQVDPIYEEQTFLLSREPTEINSNNVRLFDQIVVKGTDLYDGKPIE